jgi:2-polyprenyl-6-hydroxyphenyl methylase/3-demethylubiquinone-9 3-methyltransferase
MLGVMIGEEALPRPVAVKGDDAVCRACGGALQPAFEAVVLQDVPVTYHRCRTCGSLMLLNPYWLGRSYSSTFMPDPDVGALRRTLFVHRVLRRMRGVGLLPPRCRSLDFGSGLGMLVRLERDRDVEAFGYDLYATPKFAETFCSHELPDGPFDLITCIEVLEHTTNPVEVLSSFRARVKDGGIVVVSTELVDPGADANWPYLAREHGQHITLFSESGLRAAFDAAGFTWVRTIWFGKVPLLHVLVPEGARLPGWRVLWLRLHQVLGEFNYESDRRV